MRKIKFIVEIERAIKEIKESGLYGNQIHQETLLTAIEALEKTIKWWLDSRKR